MVTGTMVMIVVWVGSVWGDPRQVPRRWQASLRQYLYPVVTSSVLGFPSASLLVLSQLECPVSFFGAASTSAPPYEADPGAPLPVVFWKVGSLLIARLLSVIWGVAQQAEISI